MGPMNAGLPALPPGMRWKSKLITTSGTFDPAVEAPGVEFFRFLLAGGGNGGSTNTGGNNSGNQAQIMLSPEIKCTSPVTVTIGAAGTKGNPGAQGGTTTVVSANGTEVMLAAIGGGAGGQPWGSNRSTEKSGTPINADGSYSPGAFTCGCYGRVNGVPMLIPTAFTTDSWGYVLTGGFLAGPPGGTVGGYQGAGGWRGAGGNANTPPTGYGAGGGSQTSGGTDGGPGCVEVFWQEPIQ